MLQDICNWIILLGAVAVAIINILKFFGKPVSFFKKKKDKEYQQMLKKSLDEIMPNYFEQHDLQTRDKYLGDRMNYLKEIKKSVLEDTKDILEEIRKLSIEQSKNLEKLNQSSKDVLRQKIMTIYHQYKERRKIPVFAKEALDELYKDYKSQGGNSYIDKYYNRMSNWEIDYTEDEENL